MTTSTASGAYTETSGNTLLVLSGGSVSGANISAPVVSSSSMAARMPPRSFHRAGRAETVSTGSATGDQIAGAATVDAGGSVTSETVLSRRPLTISGSADKYRR